MGNKNSKKPKNNETDVTKDKKTKKKLKGNTNNKFIIAEEFGVQADGETIDREITAWKSLMELNRLESELKEMEERERETELKRFNTVGELNTMKNDLDLAVVPLNDSRKSSVVTDDIHVEMVNKVGAVMKTSGVEEGNGEKVKRNIEIITIPPPKVFYPIELETINYKTISRKSSSYSSSFSSTSTINNNNNKDHHNTFQLVTQINQQMTNTEPNTTNDNVNMNSSSNNNNNNNNQINENIYSTILKEEEPNVILDKNQIQVIDTSTDTTCDFGIQTDLRNSFRQRNPPPSKRSIGTMCKLEEKDDFAPFEITNDGIVMPVLIEEKREIGQLPDYRLPFDDDNDNDNDNVQLSNSDVWDCFAPMMEGGVEHDQDSNYCSIDKLSRTDSSLSNDDKTSIFTSDNLPLVRQMSKVCLSKSSSSSSSSSASSSFSSLPLPLPIPISDSNMENFIVVHIFSIPKEEIQCECVIPVIEPKIIPEKAICYHVE